MYSYDTGALFSNAWYVYRIVAKYLPYVEEPTSFYNNWRAYFSKALLMDPSEK